MLVRVKIRTIPVTSICLNPYRQMRLVGTKLNQFSAALNHSSSNRYRSWSISGRYLCQSIRRNKVENAFLNWMVNGDLPSIIFLTGSTVTCSRLCNLDIVYRTIERLPKESNVGIRSISVNWRIFCWKVVLWHVPQMLWKSPRRHHSVYLTDHVFNDEMKPASLLLSFRCLSDQKLNENLSKFIAC